MKTIAQVLKFIEESNGEEFTIKFIKRGTFKPREMICQVTDFKGVNNDLVNVYEINVGFRCFPLEGLKEIKIAEAWHTIVTPDVLHQQLLDDAMDQALSSGQ